MVFLEIDVLGFIKSIGLGNVISLSLVAFFAAFIQRLYDKKKYKADVVSVEQDNLKKMLETQQTWITDTKDRLDKYILEFKIREEEYLVRETQYLKKIREQELRITKLEVRVARLITKVCTNPSCQNREFLELDEE